MSNYNKSVFNQQVLAKAIETGSPAKNGNRDHHDFLGHAIVITPDFLSLDLKIGGQPHQGKAWENTFTIQNRLDVIAGDRNKFQFGTLKEIFIDPILDDAGDSDAVAEAEAEAKQIMKEHGLTSKDELEQVFYSAKGPNFESSKFTAINDFAYDLHDIKAYGYALLHNVHAASVVGMIYAYEAEDMAKAWFELA